MKTTQQFDSLLGRLEADVEARIRSLFVRCPYLHGFAVQDRAMLPKDVDPNRIPDADLFVTDIGIFPKIDSQYDEIHDEITHAISDLVQDQPHAFDYLRGRTFARSLHYPEFPHSKKGPQGGSHDARATATDAVARGARPYLTKPYPNLGGSAVTSAPWVTGSITA